MGRVAGSCVPLPIWIDHNALHKFSMPIRMYWDDHPPPHFHALYGEHEAQYNIATLDIIHGITAAPRPCAGG